jgi:hypothetical protein
VKRARFRKRNLTAQTSNSVLAQPGESLSLLFEMDKLSIQEQILVGYAIREAAYDMGLLAEKPKSLKEDTQDFCKEWIDEWKRQNNKDE